MGSSVGNEWKRFTGQRAAERAAESQKEMIAKQQQLEKLKLAESTDEIARRRLLMSMGGRRSLIASQQDTTTGATKGVTKGVTNLLGG